MESFAALACFLCFTLVSSGVVDVNIPTAISLKDFDADFTGKVIRVARTVFSKTTSFKPLKAPYGFITKYEEGYSLEMMGESNNVCEDLMFPMQATQDKVADFTVLGKGYLAVFSSNPLQYAWVFLCRDGDASITTCHADNVAVYLATTEQYSDTDAAAAQTDFDQLGITDSPLFDFYTNDEEPDACA